MRQLWKVGSPILLAPEALCVGSNATMSACQFTNFLVQETPVFDEMILEDIRPEDGWMLHVETGTFPPFKSTSMTLDRFNCVWPNTTWQWTATAAGNCLGTPCDKTEHHITWGSTRIVYSLEEQSWATPLLCWDQDMHITQAVEQYQQIISDILKPATSAITSNYLRKRVAQFCQQQYVANSSFGSSANNFTYNWVVVGAEEIYIDTNVINTNVYKLTPQMLQRRVDPLMRWGYFGKNPFKDMPPNIELVTDEQTCWELDRLGGQTGVGGVPSVTGNWRFERWEDAAKYWKYAISGTIGQYMVRVDPLQLRFNYVGPSRRCRFVPVSGRVAVHVNVPSSEAGGAPAAGLKDIPNPDFDNAQYAWSIVWHRKAGALLVQEGGMINAEMPFADRNFAGRWQFVMDNLGADVNGVAIENKRRNKGQFIADFEHAWKPMYNELSELYFHKREPACVIQIPTCSPDPGYPFQQYNSAPLDCAGNLIN